MKKSAPLYKLMHGIPLTKWDKIGLWICNFGYIFLLLFVIFIFTTKSLILSLMICLILAIGFTISIAILYYHIKKSPTQKLILKHHETKDVRHNLQDLDPYKFEEAVSLMFKAQGFKNVRTTSGSGDYGADILMEDKRNKYVVEVKKYSRDNLIGRPALQKLQGACEHYRAMGMKFVTLGYFSNEAKNYAKNNNIHLINGDELVSMFNEALKNRI